MPVQTNSEDLEIDTSGLSDLLLIGGCVLPDILFVDGAIRDMDIGRVDVDVIEEMHLHEAMITLQRIRLHGIIFVQIEGDHVPETQTFKPVHPNQFGVERFRTRSRRQSEYTSPAFSLTLTDQ